MVVLLIESIFGVVNHKYTLRGEKQIMQRLLKAAEDLPISLISRSVTGRDEDRLGTRINLAATVSLVRSKSHNLRLATVYIERTSIPAFNSTN